MRPGRRLHARLARLWCDIYSRSPQRAAAYVEAGPAAGRRGCLQHHRREYSSGRQTGRLAAAGDCLIGLAPNGSPIAGGNTFDPTVRLRAAVQTDSLEYFHAFDRINPQVDRLPLEATVGWDATLNGNLAELLQEPSLMGALEGAGITVLAKGVDFPSNPWGPALICGIPGRGPPADEQSSGLRAPAMAR